MSFYLVTPFGKLDQSNPDVIRIAALLGRTPGAVAWKLVNLAGCDPEIRNSGRTGASNCSKLDREVFKNHLASPEDALSHIDDQFWKVDDTPHHGQPVLRIGEDVIAESIIRRGQDFFRKVVTANFNGKCAVTGLSVPTLLVASHIVPWSKEKASRCDPGNGLLLNALHDKAFDRGLITFDEDMRMVVSPTLKRVSGDSYLKEELVSREGTRLRDAAKASISPTSLAYHRTSVFVD